MKNTKAEGRKQRFRWKGIHIPALGNVFQGIVSGFEDQADTATRTPHTGVDLPNPQLEMAPGMYACSSLVLDRKHDVRAVPVQGVNHTENQATVFVVKAEKKIDERPVKTDETPSNVEFFSDSTRTIRVVVGHRSQLQEAELVHSVVELAAAAGGK